MRTIFAAQGLRVFDVDELATHGGSLRVFASRAEARTRMETPRVAELLSREREAGVQTLAYYADFKAQAERVKLDLLRFLIEQKRAGHTVAAYGAAAKGNTLLNYAGIRSDLLSFVCDAAPSKQGRFLPGSHIPILAPEALVDRSPDFVLILPWNIRGEIERQLADLRAEGVRFVVAVPRLEVA